MAFYSYEQEQSRLQRLMDEVMAEEGPDDDDGEYAGDNLDNFETQIDSESEEELSDVEEVYTIAPHYIGKGGKIVWQKHEPNKNVRTRWYNLVSHIPGNTNVSKNKTTPIECWKCLFDDKIIDIIVDNTNRYIRSLAMNFSRERDAKETDKTEILALFGLLYLAGVNKSGRLNTEQLWSTNGTGLEIFRLTMSITRFRFLMRFIRFDDKDSRNERASIDKLAPIRDIFDIFVKNCEASYCTSEYVTVDEKLEAFRGRCAFKQYIPSKPNKYGIKIFAIVDAKMFYTKTMEVYVGLQPEGPYKVNNSADAIVKRLCTTISGSGRNVTMDNWFTSIDLVLDMLQNYKLTVVGTIRKNRQGIPGEFLDGKIRPPQSSMFGFHPSCTLVSYIPKKRKVVLLVSSMHNDGTIDKASGDKNKPEIISFYNETKGGVDVVDKLCSTYNCARNTRRWPMVVFYCMLNVAGINSQIIFEGNVDNKKYLVRRKFLEALSFELIQDHLRLRAANSNIPRTIRMRVRQILGITEINIEPTRSDSRGSCTVCVKKRRLTRYNCIKCKTYLCLEHSCIICQECSDAIE